MKLQLFSTAVFLLLAMTAPAQEHYTLYKTSEIHYNGFILCGDTMVFVRHSEGGIVFNYAFVGTYSWHNDTLTTKDNYFHKYSDMVKISPCSPDSIIICAHHPMPYTYLATFRIDIERQNSPTSPDSLIVMQPTKVTEEASYYAFEAKNMEKLGWTGIPVTIKARYCPESSTVETTLHPGNQYDIYSLFDGFVDGSTGKMRFQWRYNKENNTFIIIDSLDDKKDTVYAKQNYYITETAKEQMNMTDFTRLLSLLLYHQQPEYTNLLLRLRKGRP